MPGYLHGNPGKCPEILCYHITKQVSSYFNPFIPVSAKTATSQVDLQVWKG